MDRRDIPTGAGLTTIVGLQTLGRFLVIEVISEDATWSWDLRNVWRPIARDVAGGTPLYVYPAVDNKPPLWELLNAALLSVVPEGGFVFAVGVGNLLLVGATYLLAKRRYGYWLGLFTALLLVTFLTRINGLRYQPHNFAAGLLVVGLLVSRSDVAGASFGAATMFTQYGGLAFPAFLLDLRRRDRLNNHSLRRFGTGVGLSLFLPFATVAVIWGLPALSGAVQWTFIQPVAYVFEGGSSLSYLETSADYSLFASPVQWGHRVARIVLENVVIFIPAMAMSGIVVRRRPTTQETVYVTAGLSLLAPLIVRRFDHYWLFSAPFLCLLTAAFLHEVTVKREACPDMEPDRDLLEGS